MKRGTLIIKKCSRCGKKHTNLKFTQFNKPPNEDYTHWATCRNTRDPILIHRQLVMDQTGKGTA